MNPQQPAPGGRPGRPTSARPLFPEIEREPIAPAPGAYGYPNFRMRHVTLPDGTQFVVRPQPLPTAPASPVACEGDTQRDCPAACEADTVLDCYELTSEAGEHAQVDAYSDFATCDCADFRRDWHCPHVEVIYLSGLAPIGTGYRFTSSNPGLLPTVAGGAR
jgi:hypothetical protein